MRGSSTSPPGIPGRRNGWRGLRREAGGSVLQRVSVIICSIDPRKFAAASGSWQRSLAAIPCEIIGIHDARSLAEGYNRGLERAQGDILVFSHDDVDVVTPDVAERLATHLATFDVVGIAGTRRLIGGGWYLAGDPYDFMLVISPHPRTGRPILLIEGAGALVVDEVQALDGVFFAARAEVARALRFDDGDAARRVVDGSLQSGAARGRSDRCARVLGHRRILDASYRC